MDHLPTISHPPVAPACVAPCAEAAGFNLPPSGPVQPAEALCGAPLSEPARSPIAGSETGAPFPDGELTTETLVKAPGIQAEHLLLSAPAPVGASSQSAVSGLRSEAPPQAPTPRPLKPKVEDLRIGQHRLTLLARARELLAEGLVWREIGSHLGTNWQKLRRWHLMVASIPTALLTAEDLARRTSRCGRKANLLFTPEQVAQIKPIIGSLNRTWDSGSTPQALRLAIKEGIITGELRDQIEDRLRRGKPPLTPAQFNQVRVPRTAIRARRNQRNAWLELVSSPGSARLCVDPESGEQRLFQPGECWTLDDATKNFVCTVPVEKRGDPCWEEYQVVLGRFQWLVMADQSTDYIIAHSHTARPRGQYRAEDLLAVLQAGILAHGKPRAIILERGISASKLLTEALRLLDIEIIRSKNPHTKAIESIFNRLWTPLSLAPGQVGRFMADDANNDALIRSCKAGATDPRKHFPALRDTLSALNSAVFDHNAKPIDSKKHGLWVPEDQWRKRSRTSLRHHAQQDAWMFAPMVKGPLTMQGCRVTTTVQFTEEESLEFVFSAPDLFEFDGARVRVHFNPFDAIIWGTLVLAEDFGAHGAGTMLGAAEMVDATANLKRRAYGFDAPDIGKANAQRAAKALRGSGAALVRNTVAVAPGGQLAGQQHETRTAAGAVARLEVDGTSPTQPQDPGPQTPAAVPPPPRRNVPAVALPYSVRKLLAEKQTVPA